MLEPAILSSIDENFRISTRWIAKTLGKQVKHVHEDVRRIMPEFMVENEDHPRDARGYVVEYWLPLADAIYLVSGYTGDRAKNARRLISDAINYFLFQKPILEEDNLRLRNENQELAAKVPKLKLPKKPSHRYVETITIHQSLFDEGGLPLMSIVTKREKKRRDLLTPAELSAANALFSSKVYIGIKTALKNHLEDFNSKLQSELGIKFNMADTLIKTLMGD